MTEPLRMGIIGLGKQGGIRAGTVREHDDAVLVSGTDPAPPAKGFEDLAILPDYEAVIASGVDAVFVCTPNRFIPEVVSAALDAGKHVFCEKPPGRTVADIERIVDGRAAQPRPHAQVRLQPPLPLRHHGGQEDRRRAASTATSSGCAACTARPSTPPIPTAWRMRPDPRRRRHPPRPGHPHARPLPPLLRRVHRDQEHGATPDAPDNPAGGQRLRPAAHRRRPHRDDPQLVHAVEAPLHPRDLPRGRLRHRRRAAVDQPQLPRRVAHREPQGHGFRRRQPAGAGHLLQHRPVLGARAGRVRGLHPHRSARPQRHLRATPSRPCASCTASTRRTRPSRSSAPS